MKEKIMIAALKYSYKSLVSGAMKHSVMCGLTYRDIIRTIYENDIPKLLVNSVEEGFMTNTGRFVNSVEAYKIAWYAGQVAINTVYIPEERLKNSHLKPEDILKCN